MRIRKVTFGLVLVGFVVSLASAGNDVLLKYDGIEITSRDFYLMLEGKVPEHARDAFRRDNDRVRQMIADIFIRRELARKAVERGLVDNDAVRFRAEMARDGVYMDAYLADAIERAAKPDFQKAAMEEYQASKQNYVLPERVRASHILIKVTESRDEEAAKALAQDIRERALKGTTSFAELAVEFSEDSSVTTNSGDLGYFARGQMVKPFADAAFSLQIGEISEPVRTQFGYHVVKVVDHQQESIASFDEVKEQIVAKKKTAFENQVRVREIESIRSLEGIEVNQDAVTALSAE